MGRRSVVALGALLGALAAIAFVRLRAGHERVDVFYEDGSMISLEGGSEGAAAVLVHARDALRAAL